MSTTGRYLLLLFIISSLFSLYASFLAVDPLAQRSWLPAYLIYPLALATALWVLSLLPLLTQTAISVRWQRRHLGVFLAILAAWGFMISRNAPQFNIVQDEYVLSATAMNLHYNRSAAVPNRGQWINNQYILSDGYLDKRPLFFPLVLATLHDLRGYDVQNVFYLNALLALLLLWLSYVLVRRLGGDDLSALFAVMALASIPLISQSATGGGFELLNSVMLLATLLLGARFSCKPDPRSLTALAYTTFLLAQTRYESITFVLATGALILWVWWREQRIILTYQVVLLPLLFILPMLALQAVVLDRYWLQLEDHQAAAFTLNYAWNNTAKLIAYLFQLNPYGGMNPVTASLLVFGLLAFLRHLLRPTYIAFNLFLVIVLCNLLLLMGYYWGDMSDFNARRLLIVTLVIMAISTALVLNHFPRLRTGAGMVLAAGFIGITIPHTGQHAYGNAILLPKADSWALAYLRADDWGNERILIAKDVYFFIIQRYNVIGTVHAQQRAEKIRQAKNHAIADPYAYQTYFINPATGKKSYVSCHDISPQFSLDPLIHRAVGPYLYASIGRVTNVQPAPYVMEQDAACAHEIRTGNANFPKLTQGVQQNWFSHYP